MIYPLCFDLTQFGAGHLLTRLCWSFYSFFLEGTRFLLEIVFRLMGGRVIMEWLKQTSCYMQLRNWDRTQQAPQVYFSGYKIYTTQKTTVQPFQCSLTSEHWIEDNIRGKKLRQWISNVRNYSNHRSASLPLTRVLVHDLKTAGRQAKKRKRAQHKKHKDSPRKPYTGGSSSVESGW